MPTDDEDVVEPPVPRTVVGQAVKVLMTRDGVTRDDAFELLVQRSSGTHRRVREVAVEVVQHGGA